MMHGQELLGSVDSMGALIQPMQMLVASSEGFHFCAISSRKVTTQGRMVWHMFV